MSIKFEQWSVLAALRFLLALVVAVEHLQNFAPGGAFAWLAKLGAFEAILGFLLISGFSIGSSYAKEPAGFLARRAMRIYPIYLGAVALTVLAADRLPGTWTIAQNVLFLNQITTTSSFVGPAWTLALEVWLYALTPLLALLSTRTLKGLILTSFVAYVVYTCLRTLMHLPYYAGVGFGLNLLFLSFAWLCGFVFAREKAAGCARIKLPAMLFGGHLALALLIQFAHQMKNHSLPSFFSVDVITWTGSALTIVLVLLVFNAIARKKTGTVVSQPMRTLGDVSYPLYVVHSAAFTVAAGAGTVSSWALLAFALAVAAVFYYALDFYSRARSARTPVAVSTASIAAR